HREILRRKEMMMHIDPTWTFCVCHCRPLGFEKTVGGVLGTYTRRNRNQIYPGSGCDVKDHPLRVLPAIANAALRSLSGEFEKPYSRSESRNPARFTSQTTRAPRGPKVRSRLAAGGRWMRALGSRETSWQIAPWPLGVVAR